MASPMRLEAGTQRCGGTLNGWNQYSYRAVIRRGRTIVWECNHIHAVRDNGSPSSGMSASTCSSGALRVFAEHATNLGHFSHSGNGLFIPKEETR